MAQLTGRMPTKYNPLKIPTFVETEVAPHALRIDDLNGDGTLMYIGEAKVGTADSDSSWQIRFVQKVGTVTSFTYANGSGDFKNVWTDRASLSYS